MRNSIKLLGILFILGLGSCKEKEIEPTEENELITTVKLNFTNAGTVKSFKYSDPDGDGGKAAVIDKITLSPNTAYTLTIELLDESKTPTFNIGEEVAEEADEHLFIYTTNPTSLATYTYGDKDSNNFGIGLTGNFITNSAGTGNLKVQLRHQPPINGKPSKNGTSSPGSDDVNIDFDLSVQ